MRTLHSAGIEVILDVVYNHTAEGNRLGPTLSWRGLDNSSYYRLHPNGSRYRDLTGCGNTLATDRAAARRLVLDSLRYWAEEMHVDGFRFDLAPVLGREGDHDQFAPNAELLVAIAEDPALSDHKLIAEPWDLGSDGYRLGGFGPRMHEWNDRFRDALRRFWRCEPNTEDELARRIDGSRDIFGSSCRSINLVTCHDGFSLADLVTYSVKRNAENGENNRDGRDENLGSNWGSEGPSDNPRVIRLRRLARRNMLATLMLSRGVPMLRHGDELGHSQRGNNNAYCQDNEISWIDWSRFELVEDLVTLSEIRKRWSTALDEGPCSPPKRLDSNRAFLTRWKTAAGGQLVFLVNGSDRTTIAPLPSELRWQVAYHSHGIELHSVSGSIELPSFSTIVLENEHTALSP